MKNISPSQITGLLNELLILFEFEKDEDELIKMSSKKLCRYLVAQQQAGELVFNDDDFKFEDGKCSGLSLESVKTAIKIGLEVPESWEKIVADIEKQDKKECELQKADEVQEQYSETDKQVQPGEQPEEKLREELREEPEEKPKEECKEEQKKKSGKNFLGHFLSSKNSELDELMLKTSFYKDSFVEQGFGVSRVLNHVRHLDKDKKDFVEVTKLKTDKGTEYKVVKR